MNDSDLIPERSLGDYAAILYRQRYVIAVVIVVAVVASLAISWVLPPQYEAQSIFYVPKDATVSQSEHDRPALAMPTGDRDGARAQSSILKTDEALTDIHREFPYKSMEKLRRDTDVTAERSSLISVYVRDRDPKRAAEIANSFIKVFDRLIVAATTRDSDASIKRTQAEIERVQNTLAQTAAEVRELELRHSELPDIVARIKIGNRTTDALEIL